MDDFLIQFLMSMLPAILVGVLCYFYMEKFSKLMMRKEGWEMKKEKVQILLPAKLQAFERMMLFLERINPNQLLVRVQPNGTDLKSYETLLIKTIEQEFEHNLTQQLYLSSEGWAVVKSAKNHVIQLIRQSHIKSEIDTAQKMQESILSHLTNTDTPIHVAIEYLKNEVRRLG